METSNGKINLTEAQLQAYQNHKRQVEELLTSFKRMIQEWPLVNMILTATPYHPSLNEKDPVKKAKETETKKLNMQILSLQVSLQKNLADINYEWLFDWVRWAKTPAGAKKIHLAFEWMLENFGIHPDALYPDPESNKLARKQFDAYVTNFLLCWK